MEIKKQFLQKYLHSIAIDQIADEYSTKGYKILKEERIGDFQADLVAKKQDETIIIEVKTQKLSREKKQAIIKIGDFVRQHKNFKFLVIIATPPKEKKLSIDNIENELLNSFMDSMPDELDMLSTHTTIEEITDVDIDEINIDNQYVFVKGAGVVNVLLQYGSDGDQDRDDGFKTYDSYSFNFDVTMEYIKNKGFEIIELNDIDINTSSFYE
jgi:hypothetical protein